MAMNGIACFFDFCCILFLRYGSFHFEELRALGLQDWIFKRRIEDIVTMGSCWPVDESVEGIRDDALLNKQS